MTSYVTSRLLKSSDIEYMFIKHNFRSFVGLVVLTLSVLSGCASYPDSCEKESRCQLHNDHQEPATELKVDDAPRKVSICACRPWNDTGIKVGRNQEYNFTLVESESPDWKWIDGRVPSHPVDGWKGDGLEGGLYKVLGFLGGFMKRSDKTNWYALVGSVGNGKNDSDSFAVFQRANAPISMPNSGTLFIYANDKWGRYCNNQGMINLNITRIK